MREENKNTLCERRLWLNLSKVLVFKDNKVAALCICLKPKGLPKNPAGIYCGSEDHIWLETQTKGTCARLFF